METEDLSKLESCCEAFYGGNYEAQRSAHDVLLPLVSDPSCLPQLQMILARSQNPHALIFAASGLLKLISSGWNRISDTQKDDTRKFILNYLYNHGPQLLRTSSILLQNLVRLLCRIVKLGWLESLQNQNITEQVRQFLQSSTPHWVVGLTIYTVLTEDMQPTAGSQLARFRRTAMSFRETALSEIFEIAIQTLQQLNGGTMHFTDGTDERLLLRQVLQLTLNCLNFDFMGTVADEAGDDQTTVMIPHTWAILREEKIPQLFFDIYSKSWTVAGQARADCARLCLQCLVLVAAIRKSFFQKDEDRSLHVSQLIDGTSSIVQSGLGLQDDQCYHELSRLLGKINAANQIWEMSQTNGFQIWLENVFQFTMKSLENWKHLPNSKHYLVGLWSNMVGPLLYLKERAPTEVFRCIKKITTAFIDSRMKIAEAVAQAQIEELDIDYEDPLSNEVMRAEQLEVIHNLSRCSYTETCSHVMNLFQEAQTAAREGKMTPQEFQQKMTWLVYIMSSLISVTWLARAPRVVLLNGAGIMDGRMDDDTGDEDSGHRIVGEMSSLIFGLISETDKLDTAPEGLELAYLSFLEQFREVYIGERAKQTMQVQVSESLFSVLGSSSTTDVLNLMVEKLFRNLERRIRSEVVVKRTLQIFNQSVTGVSVVHAPERLPYFVVSGRLLLQSPLVKETIMDHQNAKFRFLAVPQYGKFRTTYYSTLTKLLLMDMKDDTEKFNQFIRPFKESFAQLELAVAQGPSAFETPYNRELIIHLARDLRGVVFASSTSESYNLMFNWLVNKPKQPGASRIDIFTRAVDVWWADHALMIPTLKFMVEIVHNKSQRISFDANSPNGIFLFKVVSTLLLAYGQRILGRTDFHDLYRQKYKGIACALDMFSNALSGGYTNFGVFEVYSDNVLANSLALGLQLCLAIPDEDLQAYIKSLKPFYHFLELAAQNFMEHVIRLNPDLLAQLLRCLEDGLCSFEGGVSMQCCTTIDSIVHYIFTKKDSDDEIGFSIRNFLNDQPQSLRRILQLMFQLVITGEMSGTWGMSRPLLGLILLHQNDFVQIQEQIMLQQIPERRMKLKGYFDDLMTGVDGNLTGKNKDIFTKNLYTFAQMMRASFA